MNTTDRILGEAMTPRQKRIYKDPRLAVFWAIKHGQRFPEAEPYILKATDPGYAYGYAKEVLKGRWPEAERPEAEAAIATSSWWGYRYARDVLKGRFPEGEPAIATEPRLAKYYLKQFPEARLEWAMNGWLDWLDL